ncbi:hypothetical protein [Celeribacter sp.]|uniref:hypothetical protein n=1 Tax=Celeribacter sp. TaxID=1890673 RepID=UPI003A8DA1F1
MVSDDTLKDQNANMAAKAQDLLTFKAPGRPLPPDQIHAEFTAMKGALKKPLTAQIARRICEKSGSHLIKLVSPRVDGDHATLRFDDPASNRRSTLLPSVNAPDIPFCKVVYRPLEVIGGATMSVVDHILNPQENSDLVLGAFGEVFGADILEALKDGLLADPVVPRNLGAGEFPIIFVPRADGSDLQITPVSPATTFMGMKRVTDAYFQKAQPGAPRPPRGRWAKQAVSSKPQNISGAIGGPRVRFLATMPPAMHQAEAEMYRFVHGGSFPRWRDDEVALWVMRYADMLDAHTTYNNHDTRAALDRTADRMLRDAGNFIAETLAEARNVALIHGIDPASIAKPPSLPTLLVRRRWPQTDAYDRARMALTSSHFEDRLRKLRGEGEAAHE